MNKLQLFIENFLVYGLGGMISKIVPLVMVPIVTRMMPSSEYFGISDLSNTIISLASALAILGMYDAMYRLFFEKDDTDYKKEICSTTLFFTIILSFIVFLLMLFFKNEIAYYFLGNADLAYVIYITAMATFIGATNGIVSAPTRMQNKRMVFVAMNGITPIVSYTIALILLYKGYYVIALPLAGLLTSILSEGVFLFLNYKWFQLEFIRLKHLKPLLWIAVPLFPNFLIYWLFNSSSRVMITNMLGIDAAGLYAVGSKLGMASQLIYMAFAGGWQYFAFSTMKEKDQVGTNSRIFEYLGVISFIATAFICMLAEPIYQLLFTKEYVVSFIVAPYLFLAPLLQMLFQVAANQFLVIKKTWPNMFILMAGAIFSIVFCYYLIPICGIEGAAIGTLGGYIISDIVCVIVLYKMKLMKLNIKFFIASGCMVLYLIFWRFYFINDMIIGFMGTILFSAILIGLYCKEVKNLFVNITNKNSV